MPKAESSVRIDPYVYYMLSVIELHIVFQHCTFDMVNGFIHAEYIVLCDEDHIILAKTGKVVIRV